MSLLVARSDLSGLVVDLDMPGCLDGAALTRFVHARWPAEHVVQPLFTRSPMMARLKQKQQGREALDNA